MFPLKHRLGGKGRELIKSGSGKQENLMVEVSIEYRPAFSIIGQKTFITRHDQFAAFWRASHENGVIGMLDKI
jgi:hypothetical protein